MTTECNEQVFVVSPMLYAWLKAKYGEITHFAGRRIIIKEKIATTCQENHPR